MTSLPAIPAGYADLLDDAAPATLIVTTIRRDGLPVSSPVWFVAADDGLQVTMGRGSLKVRHLRRDPRVSGIIMAPGEHNRYLWLYGTAHEAAADVAADYYRRIMRKYTHTSDDAHLPADAVVVTLRPADMRGFDYRDPPTTP